MKLKVALAKIDYQLAEHADFLFAVLRNINTGEDVYIGPSDDGAPVVMETVKEYKKGLVRYDGELLSERRYTIEEVTDHQYGLAFFDKSPVTFMSKTITQLSHACLDIKFAV